MQDIVQFRALQEEDACFCDLVHLVNRSYNTFKEVAIPSDMDNSHVISDRKIWSRDLEKEGKPVTFHSLMNWMTIEMKLRMRAPIRNVGFNRQSINHFGSKKRSEIKT